MNSSSRVLRERKAEDGTLGKHQDGEGRGGQKKFNRALEFVNSPLTGFLICIDGRSTQQEANGAKIACTSSRFPTQHLEIATAISLQK